MSENLQQASPMDRPVGQIAADIPGVALVFHDHKIDFCCAGKKTLADVGSGHGLTPMRLPAMSRRSRLPKAMSRLRAQRMCLSTISSNATLASICASCWC